MNNYTEIIEQYLRGEMSETERINFEEELKNNPYLKQEFDIQKNIIESLNKIGIKNDIQRSFIKQKLKLKLVKSSIIAFTIIVIGALIFFTIKNVKSEKESNVKDNKFTFNINNEKDTVIETPGGIIIGIPANAFDTKSDEVELMIEEALSPYDIVKKGLSTTSDGKLLSTAGMFNIEAKVGNEKVQLRKSLDVNVPTNKINPNMMLFDGQMNEKGEINWINPKKIEKELKTFDMSQLDFYPENYLPTLKALKLNHTNRKYTDSLYYSFSGYNMYNLDYLIPEQNNIYKYKDVQTPKGPTNKGIINYKYYQNIDSITYNSNIYQIDSAMSFDFPAYQIDPSKIKAIKNNTFNHTILATKEFEKRIKFMHTLCTDIYFNIYINNLNRPMYYSDSICASMSSGIIKEQFLNYYERKDGGVKISSGLQTKLSEYFITKEKAYRMASQKMWEQFNKQISIDNSKAIEEEKNFKMFEEYRKSEVFNDELCLNLIKSYEQLGQTRECPILNPAPAEAYYNVEINTTGWKNLDYYVTEATLTRSSMTYVDPSGKKAEITYTPISITITNRKEFEKVNVYLIPDKLNSFQKMEEKNKLFVEKLNGFLNYNVIAIGFKGDKIYFENLKKAKDRSYNMTLSITSESNVRKYLGKLNDNMEQDFFKEIAHEQFNVKEINRKKALDSQLKINDAIAKSIFNCFGEGEEFGDEK